MQDTGNTGVEQRLEISIGDDSSDHDRNVGPFFPEQRHHTRSQSHVCTREHGEPDHVDILVDRSGRHHLGRLSKSGVDDLHPGITQDAGNDFDPAIMSIESNLGYQYAKCHGQQNSARADSDPDDRFLDVLHWENASPSQGKRGLLVR